MLSFHFFSQSVEEAFSIFPWQQRGMLGKASSCGNLFEMSENRAVRSLGPMSGHFRVRSLGRMSGHCKAESCMRVLLSVGVRYLFICLFIYLLDSALPEPSLYLSLCVRCALVIYLFIYLRV